MDLWITASVAAKILEKRLGRPVRIDYITKLAQMNRIRKRDMGSRIVLYNRHDVEQVQIRERKKSVPDDRPSQVETPIAQIDEKVPAQEKTYQQIPLPETLQIRNTEPNKEGVVNVARFEDMPPGSMKRMQFAKTYKLHNPELGSWLEFGLKGDRLPVTYYPYHGDKAAAFNPAQQVEVLEILKRHGKLKS